jgi:hypothetical protein
MYSNTNKDSFSFAFNNIVLKDNVNENEFLDHKKRHPRRMPFMLIACKP